MTDLAGDHRSLGGAAFSGGFWNVSFALLNKGVTLAGQVALAWILLPSDMGQAAMATAMAAFVTILSVGGLGDVLIQRGHYKDEAMQALWLSAGMSVATALLIAALAPVAVWQGRPGLAGLLLIIAVGPLIGFPSTVLSAGLKDRLAFKVLAAQNIYSGLTFTVTAIGLAWAGWGPYALILPNIPAMVVSLAYQVHHQGWPVFERPRFPLLRQMFRPTFALAVTGVLTGLQSQAPVFVTGLVLDATATGHFSWGWAVAAQAVYLLATNLREVLLPVLAKLNHDPQRQAVATLESMRLLTAALCLACGAQGLLAKPLMALAFPQRWQGSGAVVQWMSLGLGLQGIWVSGMAWLNATGRYRVMLWLSATQVALVAGAAYVGARMAGAEGAAVGTALGTASSAAMQLVTLPRAAFRAQAAALGLPLAFAAILWALAYRLLPANAGCLYALGAAGGFVGLSAILWWHWNRTLFRRVWDLATARWA